MPIRTDKVDARQGDRHKENFRVLIISLALLAAAVAVGGIFLSA